MDFNPLTNDDVADILALLDSLPYDELDLETPRFRLTLRRTPAGWTQSTQILSASEPTSTATMSHRGGPNRINVTSLRSGAGAEEGGRAADEADGDGGDGDGGGGACDPDGKGKRLNSSPSQQTGMPYSA